MANVEVAVRFRREAGDDFAASGLEVGLQLLGCVSDAHFASPRLRTEAHHFVHLHCPQFASYTSPA